MKKAFKLLLLFVLSISLSMSLLSCNESKNEGNTTPPVSDGDGDNSGSGNANNNSANGTNDSTVNDIFLKVDSDTIKFGSYPQSAVTDNTLKNTLTRKAGILPTDLDNQAWTSYGYYVDGIKSNYMWYIDISEGDTKYRGVYFTEYRPHNTNNTHYSSHFTHQEDNEYFVSAVYWFKYEPISWTVLTESNGKAFLLCDMIIDSQAYQNMYEYKNEEHYILGTNYYTNNYAESTIRKWLNEVFYNTAFNDLQKTIIETTEVDNSAYSTGRNSNPYACENTNDKIFLPSYQEITNKAYGFSSFLERERKTTDYSLSQGAYTSSGDSYDGNGVWWLRSPDSHGSNYTRSVSKGGNISNRYDHADVTSNGIVPALWIRL